MCESAGPLNPRGSFPGSHGQPVWVEVGRPGLPRTHGRVGQTAILLSLLPAQGSQTASGWSRCRLPGGDGSGDGGVVLRHQCRVTLPDKQGPRDLDPLVLS